MTTTFVVRTKQIVKEKLKMGLANVGTHLGKEALKAGVQVATTTAAKWILQHYGGFDIG